MRSNCLILPIIKIRLSLLSNVLQGIIVFSFIALLMNVFILEINALNILFVILLAMGFIANNFVKIDYHAGDIILTGSTIQINQNPSIPLPKVKKLTVNIGGYEGRKGLDNIKSFFSDDGQNNWITYSVNDKLFKYQFLLTEKNYLKIFQIMKIWETNQIKFNFETF